MIDRRRFQRDVRRTGHAIFGLGAIAEPVVHAEDRIALREAADPHGRHDERRRRTRARG